MHVDLLNGSCFLIIETAGRGDETSSNIVSAQNIE